MQHDEAIAQALADIQNDLVAMIKRAQRNTTTAGRTALLNELHRAYNAIMQASQRTTAIVQRRNARVQRQSAPAPQIGPTPPVPTRAQHLLAPVPQPGPTWPTRKRTPQQQTRGKRKTFLRICPHCQEQVSDSIYIEHLWHAHRIDPSGRVSSLTRIAEEIHQRDHDLYRDD